MDEILYKKLQAAVEEMNRYFVGKEEVVENVLICLLAGGHVLLQDVPGVGKTTLATMLSTVMGLTPGRIQLTPDTMPGDVVGVSVYNKKTDEFEYRPGAAFCQVLLADEINRTMPKTQSGLLEAMAEGQVTVDGKTYPLPDPFFVIATQNPIEYLGTYPLPEAQLDRFMMRLSIGYPSEEDALTMARNFVNQRTPGCAKAVCSQEEVKRLREEVAGVRVEDKVLSYITDLVEKTRQAESYALGASPRAALALISAARGRAYLSGRMYATPDDVKAVADKVLLHRLVLNATARLSGEDEKKTFANVLRKVKVQI